MGLAPILPVLLHLQVHDWYYIEFTAGASVRSSSNAQITSFRLVFYVTVEVSLPYFQYYSVLLVHD
jgi:hypothetical protein